MNCLRKGLDFVPLIFQFAAGWRIETFPEVGLLVDCTVQRINMPTGLHADVKGFYSSKNGCYCVKVENAHHADGSVAFFSLSFNGARHDFSIFVELHMTYKDFSLKDISEQGTPDHQTHWALMADKGYQGANRYLRTMIPQNAPPNRRLGYQEKAKNDEIAKCSIIVENFYGRLKKNFRCLSDTLKLSQNFYDTIYSVCLALTNFHIGQSPLNVEYAILHRNLVNELIETNRRKNEEKRKKDQEYRNRIKLRRSI